MQQCFESVTVSNLIYGKEEITEWNLVWCYFTNMLTGNYSKLYTTFLAGLWYPIPSAIADPFTNPKSTAQVIYSYLFSIGLYFRYLLQFIWIILMPVLFFQCTCWHLESSRNIIIQIMNEKLIRPMMRIFL